MGRGGRRAREAAAGAPGPRLNGAASVAGDGGGEAAAGGERWLRVIGVCGWRWRRKERSVVVVKESPRAGVEGLPQARWTGEKLG